MDRDTVRDFGPSIMRADGLARVGIGRQGHRIGIHLEDPRQADQRPAAPESVHRDRAGVQATTFILGRETLEFARALKRFP